MTRPYRLALVGAPNSGKSTLFNGLTGGRAKVANYAGVTVEQREGTFTTPSNHQIDLVDLPGIYGLTARSLDERVAVEAITGKSANNVPPDGLIVLIDAADLRTHLHLALQLKSLGRPMVIALNMMDLAERDGVKIDIGKLSALVGAPVVATSAPRKAGRAALLEALDQAIADGYLGRAAEQDQTATVLSTSPAEIKACQDQARTIVRQVIVAEPVANRITRDIDRVVLNPVLGLLVLAGLLFFMFQAVYAWAEAPMTWIEDAFAALSGWVGQMLPDNWVRGLISDGIIAGVGGVLVFLPQIVILFALILLLEASGYMARAAFLMDELLLRVGLNGRAFIPLLSSFACAIPGMMAARTIENDRDRLTTILVAPLMTCSARLPVYTLIIAAFIPRTNVGPFNLQGLVMFALYLAGVVSAILMAVILKRTVTKGTPQPLLMELPTYKWPDLQDYALNLWAKAWAFLKRAGGIIFVVSVVLWVLVTFPNQDGVLKNSFAGMLGGLIEPIFRPIGFNLEMVIALIPGMAAREVAVGALGTVYATGAAEGAEAGLATALSQAWSLPTALAFLAWYVYAPQCIATIGVARRETNSAKWTWFMVGYLFALAYIVAGATYWIAKACGL